uniref:Putative rna polymerase ii c-terminal domain-binding protein ra4 corethrella appendiculata n=1 Tax=Lutzomyia longipalpis TaxID=7200 RepID=A0A1B0C9D8_LUTLO
MSFGFNPMGNNPMHAMMPMMGNIPNGGNFMTALSTAGMASMSATPHTVMANLAGMNDSPLEFNLKKNLPQVTSGAAPMDLENDQESRGSGLKGRESAGELKKGDTMGNGLEGLGQDKGMGAMTLQQQNEMMFNGMMGMPQGFMMMTPGMMNMLDPAMLGLQQFPLVSSMIPPDVNSTEGTSTVKEIITCKSCTLFPPNPSQPIPTTRERPPGCRTVFVGGLPENTPEDVIREVFERCGEITTLRLSKKNFCHIRFAFEASVESAIYLSGYRLRIVGQTETTHSGRLHVDYAQARDDLYDWECRNRQLQREQRHRERLERDRMRSLSPPPIVHYTDHEATAIAERLKQEESFLKAVHTLVTWLERGDCNKRNANMFYSMIQSTNSHARDDLYDWECRNRQLQREQRHRERLERDRMRSLSPPPIVHYTDHEATAIAERLKQEESFLKAVHTLVTWLERGDCNKRNANMFYSMIQSTNSHVRRLSVEKQTYEDELQKARDFYKAQMQTMMSQYKFYSVPLQLTQVTQIKKVFGAASHKKVWDHFTKAQRKNIDLWKKQTLDISTSLDDIHDEDEMEMSDDDKESSYRATKRAKIDNDVLKEENDSLRCQLEAYKNEFNTVKSDLKSDTDIKDQQIKVLQETIRNMQTQLLENKSREMDKETKIADLEAKLKAANVKELLLKTKIAAKSAAAKASSADSEDGENAEEVPEAKPIKVEAGNTEREGKLDPEEAKIIGLVSTFLMVHPFGASTDYIYSYVHRVAPHLRPKGLEEILSKYENLFVEQVKGIGAKIERNWRFCGFDE